MFRVLPVLLLLTLVSPSFAQEGGWRKARTNDPAVVAAARFAVKAQPKEAKVFLRRVTAARSQLVAGMNYEVTLLVIDRSGGKPVARTAVAVVYEDLDGNRSLTSWKWQKPAEPSRQESASTR